MANSVTGAYLSKEVYRELRGEDFIDAGKKFEILEVSPPSPSGYYGAIVKDTQTNEVILVNRGTTPSDFTDLKSPAPYRFSSEAKFG